MIIKKPWLFLLLLPHFYLYASSELVVNTNTSVVQKTPESNISNYLWLDQMLMVTEKSQASFYVKLPLSFDEEKQQWLIQGWFWGRNSDENSGNVKQEERILAFAGFTDEAEPDHVKFIGDWVAYYRNGQQAMEAFFDQDGNQHGQYRTFFAEGDRVKEVGEYVNGQLTGEQIIYHVNGNIQEYHQFINGQRIDGNCIHYYADGSIEQKHSYRDGKLNGLEVTYFTNGYLAAVSLYHDDRQVGDKRRYFDSGQLHVINYYDEQGREHGKQERFYEDGHPAEIKDVEYGNVRLRRTWYPTHQVQSEESWDCEGSGEVKEWYENGQLQSHHLYQQGELEGEQKTWYEEGVLDSLYHYQAGVMHGLAEKWALSGQKQHRTEYWQGKRHGTERIWDGITGNLVSQITYVEDQIVGEKLLFTSDTGELKEKTPYVMGRQNGISENYDGLGRVDLTCYHDGKWKSALQNATQVVIQAEQRETDAVYQLGRFHYECSDNTDDEQTALALLQDAAEYGDLNAIHYLFDLYQQWEETDELQQQILHFVRIGAELGDAYFQGYLGFLYYQGRYLEQDYQQSHHWLNQAIVNEQFGFAYYLGELYARGLGVKPDMERAIRFYQQAASVGESLAINRLQQLESDN